MIKKIIASLLFFSSIAMASPPVIWDAACPSGIFSLPQQACLTTSGLGYLPLTGGTMTGALVLSGNAVNPLNPVTFQQFNLGLLGLSPKGSVQAASTSNINLSSPASNLFDTHAVNIGEPVLIDMQLSAIENGIYIFNGIGVPMTRSPLLDVASNARGVYVSIVNGATYGGQLRICISDPAIVGTDPLIWDFQNAGAVTGDGTTIYESTPSILSIVPLSITDSLIGNSAGIQLTKLQALSGNSFGITDASGFLSSKNLAGGYAVITDSFGLPEISVTTAVELGYLEGVTSNVQGQIDNIVNNYASLPVDLSTDVTHILPVGNGGTGSGSFAIGSIPYYDGGSLVDNNADLYWGDASHFLGIRTNSNPVAALTIGQFPALTTYSSMADAEGLMISSPSGQQYTQIIESAATSPAGLALSRRGGTSVGSFEDLGYLYFLGNTLGGTTQEVGAMIRAISSSPWTTSSTPANIDFFTTPIGSNFPVQRARIHSGGTLYVGNSGLTAQVGTVSVGPIDSSTIGYYLRSMTGQTADLLRLDNDSAVKLMGVDASGNLLATSLKTNGITGSGFLELNNQAVGATAPATGTRHLFNGIYFKCKVIYWARIFHRCKFCNWFKNNTITECKYFNGKCSFIWFC